MPLGGWAPHTKWSSSSPPIPRMRQLGSPLKSMRQIRDDENSEKQIQDEALEIIKKEIDDDTVGIVVASDKWDEKAEDAAKGKEKGVVGIVAARLKETFYKPTVVLAIDGDEATGSGRCIEGMNLADSFVACTELLVKHGGHASSSWVNAQNKKYSQIQEGFQRIRF